MLSLEGKQLGNYDVIRRIRVGGMGAVYEGRQRTAFDRRVAIKVILGDYATDPDMRRRFAREARTIARLHHPHILPLIEFGDEQGILYLVMPFIEGGTLTSYLRRCLPDLAEVAALYEQLLDAVEYAHDEGLIHRDIKSSNVLLEHRRNAAPYLYLADFGLVRTSRQLDTQTGKPIPLDQVPGTPHYMAPEQTRGIVTTVTDIYALGVLLYQMLTGELPYNDDDDVRVIQMHLQAPIPSPCDHDASIPLELGDVVRKAMAKRPENRYASVGELRAAFLAAIKGPVTIVQDDEEVEPEQSAPAPVTPRRPIPAPLPLPAPRRQTRQSVPLDPAPIVMMSQRLNREAPAVALSERARQRNTDTIKERQRITEEPVRPIQQHRKRFRLSALAMMIVPIVLLILLIMPRLLGVSLFPAGFPLFGTPPIATILITPQSKTLQDRFVLTASPQMKTADLATHTIPDRVLQDSASDNSTVATTGTKLIAGVPSRGTVTFMNNGTTAMTIPAGQILKTPAGVQVRLLQAVQVPPGQKGGQSGKANGIAQAVDAGIAGNIPAHALDGPCCNTNISITNLAPFAGGVNPQSVHIVSQADLDGVKKTLQPKLQQQIGQQLQKQLTPDEVIAGQPTYTATVTTTPPVGTAVDRVQVTITLAGTAVAYSRTTASQTASQLLSKQATQTLGNTYQLRGGIAVAQPSTVEAGKDGVVYLSVSASGLWTYTLSDQQISQWSHSIKGATSPAALAYLNAQPGISTVEIHLPFGADHLPTSVDDIKILLVNQP